MVVQQQQRPACMITIVDTAPPLFVEATQAEFRAVVQRLTGSSSAALSSSNNNTNNQKLQYDHFTSKFHLPSSQSEAIPTESPIVVAFNRRLARASCAGGPKYSVASSGNSESPCGTSDDAGGRSLLMDAHHECNGTSCNTETASSSKRIKVGERQQPLHIDCNGTDPEYVQQSSTSTVSLLNKVIPEASSFSCTPSNAAAATPAATASLASPLHTPAPPASLSAASHAGPGFLATDSPGVGISGSTGQLTAVSPHDGDSSGRFYCDPGISLSPLMDPMAARERHQELEVLMPAFLHSSSTSPTSTAIAASPPLPSYPSTPEWEIWNSSFSWKDDDALCV